MFKRINLIFITFERLNMHSRVRRFKHEEKKIWQAGNVSDKRSDLTPEGVQGYQGINLKPRNL